MRKEKSKVGDTGVRLSAKNAQRAKRLSPKTGQEKRRMTENIETWCCDAHQLKAKGAPLALFRYIGEATYIKTTFVC